MNQPDLYEYALLNHPADYVDFIKVFLQGMLVNFFSALVESLNHPAHCIEPLWQMFLISTGRYYDQSIMI